MVFILLYHLVVSRPAIRGFVVRVGLMALVSVFVAVPVILLAARDPDGFFDRTRVTSLFTFTPREEWADHLTSSLVKHSLMFGREGDHNPRHNLPHAPMLDYVTGALFVLGFFFALTRWRSGAVFPAALLGVLHDTARHPHNSLGSTAVAEVDTGDTGGCGVVGLRAGTALECGAGRPRGGACVDLRCL